MSKTESKHGEDDYITILKVDITPVGGNIAFVNHLHTPDSAPDGVKKQLLKALGENLAVVMKSISEEIGKCQEEEAAQQHGKEEV